MTNKQWVNFLIVVLSLLLLPQVIHVAKLNWNALQFFRCQRIDFPQADPILTYRLCPSTPVRLKTVTALIGASIAEPENALLHLELAHLYAWANLPQESDHETQLARANSASFHWTTFLVRSGLTKFGLEGYAQARWVSLEAACTELSTTARTGGLDDLVEYIGPICEQSP